MKTNLTMLLVTVICSGVASAATVVPFDDVSWERPLVTVPYLGRDATVLQAGPYALKNVDMTNGRVDVDIAMHGQRGFVGVVFRYREGGNFELVYLRPHKSRLPDAVQYAPSFNQLTTWQLYSEGYMSATELPHNRWGHGASEFQGTTARVYIDDRPEPALVINDLKHGEQGGSVGLWGRNVAHFSDFSYTPLADETREAKAPVTPEIPANVITDWELSNVYEASRQSAEELPAGATWVPVTAEYPGLVNVSRTHAKFSRAERTDKNNNLDLVYARTTINSRSATLQKLNFGYSDQVVVFLNGQPIYRGQSGFGQRYPNSLGILSDQHDSVWLPLKRGDNELVFAVTEAFGGWGLMASTPASD